MKEFIKIYLAPTSILFTGMVLVCTGINLLDGYECITNRFFPELLFYMICCDVIDYLLSNVDFRSIWKHRLTVLVIYYLLLLVMAALAGWITFNAVNLIRMTVIYLIASAVVHRFRRMAEERESRQINDLLQK